VYKRQVVGLLLVTMTKNSVVALLYRYGNQS